jgi:hypothetical protein
MELAEELWERVGELFVGLIRVKAFERIAHVFLFVVCRTVGKRFKRLVWLG